tara:strand:- start:1944 stop:2354 length:411 start_codon:yes stop_codon:yes gene_type:complete
MAEYTELNYESDQTIYSDIDLSFKPNAATGDLLKTKNATVIKQSIRNILQTRQNERLGHPEIGAGILELLFEPMNNLTETRMVTKIADALRILEPRATVRDIIVEGDPDRNSYKIQVVFTMLGQQTTENFETYLYR